MLEYDRAAKTMVLGSVLLGLVGFVLVLSAVAFTNGYLRGLMVGLGSYEIPGPDVVHEKAP